jgi:predicted nucleic acid-binding protein
VIHLDTSFVVDLLREQKRDRFGAASNCLETLPGDEVLAVSVHVVCELMAGAHAAGAPKGEVDRLSRLCETLVVRCPDETFAVHYGRLLARLRASGTSIDTMDMLIGTAAVIDDAPLITRNTRHFSKVPGLQIVEY